MELLTACCYLFAAMFAVHVGLRAIEGATSIAKIRIVGGR